MDFVVGLPHTTKGYDSRAFYPCAIIKVQNDLYTTEREKSSSIPFSEISFSYIPLPSTSIQS
jgi:hypothetical protein